MMSRRVPGTRFSPGALPPEAARWGRACPDFRYDPDPGESWADRFDLDGNPQLERGWPLERMLFLMAGTVTIASALLAWLVSPWFLILTAFVGVSQ